MRIPIAELPTHLELDDAVEAAYPGELAQVEERLRRKRRVLLECPDPLGASFYAVLRRRLQDPADPSPLRSRWVDGSGGPPLRRGGIEVRLSGGTRAGRVLAELERWLAAGDPRLVLAVPHLELLLGRPERALELGALLDEHPEARVLALLTPGAGAVVPEPLVRRFPERGELGPVAPDRLRHLVTRAEGRKLGVAELDLGELAAALEGLDAVSIRGALAALEGRVDFDPREPDRRARLLSELGGLPRPPVEL